jgi:hypothetical protein
MNLIWAGTVRRSHLEIGAVSGIEKTHRVQKMRGFLLVSGPLLLLLLCCSLLFLLLAVRPSSHHGLLLESERFEKEPMSDAIVSGGWGWDDQFGTYGTDFRSFFLLPLFSLLPRQNSYRYQRGAIITWGGHS